MTAKVVLVCGGRKYTDAQRAFDVLEEEKPDMIIQGGAIGADEIADTWARARGVPSATVKPQWRRYGKRAGPIRNSAMLMLQPSLVIAFPGGAGTVDMVSKARAAGIEVREIT